MSMANQVTYRDLDSSDALNSIIEKRIKKLQRYSSRIIRSRVVLDSPHNHKHKGKMYRATIEIDTKGSPITVTHNDASIHIAVRDAFNVVERKLKATTEQMQAKRGRLNEVDNSQQDIDNDLGVVA